MNRKLEFFLTTLLSLFFILNSAKNVSATVGGPIYISQIAYKASDKTLLYVENNYGGRGCPPLIHSVDLSTFKDSEVKSCDQVQTEFFSNYNEESSQKYQLYISDFYKDLPYLSSISLKKNNINIKIDPLSEHMEGEEKWWTNFKATVLQNNKEVGTFEFKGCNKDQPHLFEGYRIPDSDIMAILVSNKGDCIEGGYVYENIFPVKGITLTDITGIRNYKTDSPSEPNSGNLVLFADSENSTSITPTPAQNQIPQQNNLSWSSILINIGVFSIGLLLGVFFKKGSVRKTQNTDIQNIRSPDRI